MDNTREKAIQLLSAGFVIVFCAGLGALVIFVDVPVEAAGLQSTISTLLG